MPDKKTHIVVTARPHESWLTCPTVTVLAVLTEEQAKTEERPTLAIWYRGPRSRLRTRPPCVGEKVSTFLDVGTVYAIAPTAY